MVGVGRDSRLLHTDDQLPATSRDEEHSCSRGSFAFFLFCTGHTFLGLAGSTPHISWLLRLPGWIAGCPLASPAIHDGKLEKSCVSMETVQERNEAALYGLGRSPCLRLAHWFASNEPRLPPVAQPGFLRYVAHGWRSGPCAPPCQRPTVIAMVLGRMTRSTWHDGRTHRTRLHQAGRRQVGSR